VLDFGAFVDLGGVDGLIPISQLSYATVEAVSDVVSPGDSVEVEVLRIEEDPKRPGQPRIGLSLKAAQQDPFDLHADALAVGSEHDGKVMRVEKYGAFVEILPGLQGLVHVSELGYERVRQPGDVVQVGDDVRVRILGVDRGERRISLSIKDAQPEPVAADGSALVPGAPVEGVVERVERYGVFVRLTGGPQALLPASQTGTDKGTDLAKAFPVGTMLRLRVIEVDDRGRIKVSKKAHDEAEGRAELEAYNRGQTGSGRGFGTLGDLLEAKARK
jgi:small subunit ribosomal protein S1